MVHTVVVGLGRSGIGAAELLTANQISTAAIDSGNSDTLQRAAKRLRDLGLDVRLETPLDFPAFLSQQSWIIRFSSQGIHSHRSRAQEA